MKNNIPETDLSKSSIFRDYHTLDFWDIPNKLYGREKELHRLLDIYSQIFQGKAVNCLILARKTGAGKTVLGRFFGKMMEQQGGSKAKLKVLYINCINFRSTQKILDEVIINIMEKNERKIQDDNWISLECEERIQIINEKLEKTGKHLLLIIDEMGMLGRDEIRFLLLLKLKMRNLKISFLFISSVYRWRIVPNSINWQKLYEFLDGVLILEFYNFSQVDKIMRDRRDKAFKKDVLDDECLNLISQNVFEYENIRLGIRILKKAGLLAEKRESSKISPNDIRESAWTEAPIELPDDPSLFHFKMMYDVVDNSHIFDNLNDHEIFTLLGIAKTLRDENKAYILSDEAYPAYKINCKKFSVDAQDQTSYDQYLSKLKSLGLIRNKMLTKTKKSLENREITILHIPTGTLEELIFYYLTYE